MKTNKKAEVEKNGVVEGKIKKKKLKKQKQLNGENQIITTSDLTNKALDSENLSEATSVPEALNKNEVQNKNKKLKAPAEKKEPGNKPNTKKKPTNQKEEPSNITENTKQNIKKQNKKSNVNPNEPQKREPASSDATIFVGNLPTNTKRIQIAQFFKKYKPIHSIRLCTAHGQKIFKHKQRRESSSLIAYVAFTSVENAMKALELNGTKFKDNHLRITPVDQKEGNDNVKRTIFVGNLKYSATDEKLREIFSSCGEIEYVRCLQDHQKGCKGVAYVCFKSPESVGLAL